MKMIDDSNLHRWSASFKAIGLVGLGFLLLSIPLRAQPAFAWAAHFGSTGSDHGINVAVDGGGNVIVSGYFSGTADLDPGPGTDLHTTISGTDLFVVKLDPWGHFIWGNALGSTQANVGHIALDPAGNVYLASRFFGTADLDPGPAQALFTASGFLDAFVSKWDSNGNFLWAKTMGGTGNAEGLSIAVDGSGNVLSAGTFTGTADFDPGAGTFNLTSAGVEDVFVSKLDPSGNFVWAKAFGGSMQEKVEKMAVDVAGNV